MVCPQNKEAAADIPEPRGVVGQTDRRTEHRTEKTCDMLFSGWRGEGKSHRETKNKKRKKGLGGR